MTRTRCAATIKNLPSCPHRHCALSCASCRHVGGLHIGPRGVERREETADDHPHADHGAESARGISPRAAHRSVRESLDSHGSCHSEKAAAFRRHRPAPPDTGWPHGSVRVTCSLRSPGITPFQRYYGAVRPWRAHQYFRPRGSSACAFSLLITSQVHKFRTKARIGVTSPAHRTPCGQ